MAATLQIGMYYVPGRRAKQWPLKEAFEEGKRYRQFLKENIRRAEEVVWENERVRQEVLELEDTVLGAVKVCREEADLRREQVMALQEEVNRREMRKLEELREYQTRLETEAALRHAYTLAGMPYPYRTPPASDDTEPPAAEPQEDLSVTMYSALQNLISAQQAAASYTRLTQPTPPSPPSSGGSTPSDDSLLPPIHDPLDALPECLPEEMSYGDDIDVVQEGWEREDDDIVVATLDDDRLKWSKLLTIGFLVLHFVQPVLNIIVMLSWLRSAQSTINSTRVSLFRVFTCIGTVVYLLFTSVLYMWSLRGWSEYSVISRRVKGLVVNFFFADLPMFCVEANIVVNFGFPSVLFTIAFCITTFSFIMSGVRAWAFIMRKFIQQQDAAYQGSQSQGPYLAYSTAPDPHSSPTHSRYQPFTDTAASFPSTRVEDPKPGAPAFMRGDNSDLYRPKPPKHIDTGVIPASAFADVNKR